MKASITRTARALGFAMAASMTLAVPAFAADDLQTHGWWGSHSLGTGDQTYYQVVGISDEGEAGILIVTKRGECSTEAFGMRFDRARGNGKDLHEPSTKTQLRIDENPVHRVNALLTADKGKKSYNLTFAGMTNKAEVFEEMVAGDTIRGRVELPWQEEPRYFAIPLDGAGAAIDRMRSMCQRDTQKDKNTAEYFD